MRYFLHKKTNVRKKVLQFEKIRGKLWNRTAVHEQKFEKRREKNKYEENCETMYSPGACAGVTVL